MMLGIAFIILTAGLPVIAGLHLGMTADDAMSTLRAHGGDPDIAPKPCLVDLLAQRSKVVSTIARYGSCVGSISVRYAGGDLLLWFDEALPAHPGTSVLTEIALNYPSDQRVLSDVARRAGKPSLTRGGNPWTVAMWCYGFTCTDMDNVILDPHSGPILSIHAGCCLVVTNAEARTQYGSALSDALASRGVTILNR